MIQYGYCFVGAVSVRENPSSLAEQVTQLLFGDFVEILQERKAGDSAHSWSEIRILDDDYKGWVDSRQLFTVQEKDYRNHKYIVKDFVGAIAIDQTVVVVPFGAKVIDLDYDLAGHKFHCVNPKMLTAFLPYNINNLSMVMINYLNCPYQWGGKSVMGIDCSGLTQMVYSFFAKKLPRNASQQALLGQQVDFENIKEGDLMFFGNDNKISHVGIAMKDNHIYHSSAYVHVDSYDRQGIIDTFSPSIHSHQFVKAMRL